MDLITIVVPVYNVEKYISDCLDSLLSQSYKNIEIILVNDGSTNNCLEVCTKFSHLDNRIIVPPSTGAFSGFTSSAVSSSA